MNLNKEQILEFLSNRFYLLLTLLHLMRRRHWKLLIYDRRSENVITEGNCVVVEHTKAIRKDPEVNDLSGWPNF